MIKWKEAELGEYCDFQEGYVNPSKEHPEYFGGSVKWCRAVDINDGYIYHTSQTLTEEGFKSAKKVHYYLNLIPLLLVNLEQLVG